MAVAIPWEDTPVGRAADDRERRTRAHGERLLVAMGRYRHASATDGLLDRLMALATQDEALKVELFRFVDTLPALESPEAVARHLREYLLRPDVPLPGGGRALLSLLRPGPLSDRLLATAARTGTRLMARRFIAGEDDRAASEAAARLRRTHRAFTLDLLGEAVISESEALAYQTRYLELIRSVADAARRWQADPQTDEAPFGPVPRVNVSVKLSSLVAHFDPIAADATAESVKARLRPILTLARERGAFVNVDREQYSYRDITGRIFEEILCESAFRDWSDIGIVVQAYLRDSETDLRRLLAWARDRGTPVWVRLVKGAYWDYETIVAAQNGHPVPVYACKEETDASFERLTDLLLRNHDILRPAIATHNVRSAAHALAVVEELSLPPRTVEFQALYGMGDPISRALAAAGERVRIYVPVGEILPGMAYLVRRLLENTSNESFIRQASERADAEALLRKPEASIPSDTQPAALALSVSGSFRNEPETDFAVAENRERMRAALAQVRERLGESVPVVIDGVPEETPETFARRDPSDNARVVAYVSMATETHAERALAAAERAFPTWRATPVSHRAAVLRGVAAEFRRRRFEIAAWEVFEVGKPWREADADVAEAIDFCEFYAAEMERLAEPRRRNVPGEWNEYLYDARGPTVVIAPWNFPLAILTGMTVAALVAGNTVIVKPAEQSSRTGYFLYEALVHAGAPIGAAQFLPADGERIGPRLVADPRVATVAFTGSKAVGLSILREAAEVRPGQREVKRVIAEMGGKNAVIVDEDADLDEAVQGVLASATGYAGQKCSAGSRAIVIGSAYEPFCARLADAVRSLRIGPADDPATDVPAVVDADARDRILEYGEIGFREGKLLAERTPPDDLAVRGWYVPVRVFTDCPPGGRLCQEEVFGPLLAVLRAGDMTGALRLADDSPYALTGGLYTRSPENIARVRREFRVGNLYINRKITGALVDRQPFGGARMSGVGSKAGGPDYLLQFLIPRTVTESVMRRGFAPTGEG